MSIYVNIAIVETFAIHSLRLALAIANLGQGELSKQ